MPLSGRCELRGLRLIYFPTCQQDVGRSDGMESKAIFLGFLLLHRSLHKINCADFVPHGWSTCTLHD